MTDGKGALHRIRVIDLGRHQAGPRCAPPPRIRARSNPRPRGLERDATWNDPPSDGLIPDGER